MREAVRKAVLLGQGDEIYGKDSTVLRVLAACQGFQADERTDPQLNAGLEARNKEVVVTGVGFVLQVCPHWGLGSSVRTGQRARLSLACGGIYDL